MPEEKILTAVPKTMEIVKPIEGNLNEDQAAKFLNNLLRFTAPFIAVFFGQLALGVNWKAALPVALVALYAAVSDFFSKYNSNTPYLRDK